MKNNILETLNKTEKEYVQIKSVKNNTVLYREGDKCESIVILMSGEVKIFSYSFEGKELIYNILKKNDIFGNNLIFSDEPYYKGDVITTKDSIIAIINKDKLIKLLQSNKDFLINYLNIQSNFTKKLNSTIKLLSFSSAEDRLNFYLHENNNVVHFDSITSLSTILHLQRETLSRLLTKLEKENIIRRSLHKIELIN